MDAAPANGVGSAAHRLIVFLGSALQKSQARQGGGAEVLVRPRSIRPPHMEQRFDASLDGPVDFVLLDRTGRHPCRQRQRRQQSQSQQFFHGRSSGK